MQVIFLENLEKKFSFFVLFFPLFSLRKTPRSLPCHREDFTIFISHNLLQIEGSCAMIKGNVKHPKN